MFVKNEILKQISAQVVAQAENAISKKLTDLEKTLIEFGVQNGIMDFVKTLNDEEAN